MFVDHVKIYVKAGDGGNGAVSFRREKYVAAGGPDGGDGGRGGNIVLRIDEGTNTLLAFRYKRKFIAPNGGDGKACKMHGASGDDLVSSVPPGTLVRDGESGKIIKDMSNCEDYVLCKGGRGGSQGREHNEPLYDGDGNLIGSVDVTDVEPGKGTPGVNGVAGCVVVYWDKEESA